MNSKQQQIIDEAFGEYSIMVWRITNMPLYDKEEFINECKTNPEFSQKWGLKIEERELSEDERYDLLTQQMTKLRAIRDEDYINYNIPTRLITITHNNKTIASYER